MFSVCLLFIAWRQVPGYPVIVLANRDEFHARPTRASRFWSEQPHLLAGRDLKAGGTWLGVTRSGRFAAVTNVRNPAHNRDGRRSRGELVTGFLNQNSTPDAWCAQLATRAEHYNGFNLLCGDDRQLAYLGEPEQGGQRLAPALYGVSNQRLDTPWPKLRTGKMDLARLLTGDWQLDDLFALMRDETTYPDHQLPDTGIGLAWERRLSSRFIRTPDYGTRATTVLLIDDQGEITWQERGFDAAGQETERSHHQFHREAQHAC